MTTGSDQDYSTSSRFVGDNNSSRSHSGVFFIIDTHLRALLRTSIPKSGGGETGKCYGVSNQTHSRSIPSHDLPFQITSTYSERGHSNGTRYPQGFHSRDNGKQRVGASE